MSNELELIFRGMDGKESAWCVHDDDGNHLGGLFYHGEQKWSLAFRGMKDDEGTIDFNAKDIEAAEVIVNEKWAKFKIDRKDDIAADTSDEADFNDREKSYMALLNSVLEANMRYAMTSELRAAHGKALAAHMAIFTMNMAEKKEERLQLLELIYTHAKSNVEEYSAHESKKQAVGEVISKIIQAALPGAHVLAGGLGVLVPISGAEGEDGTNEEDSKNEGDKTKH